MMGDVRLDPKGHVTPKAMRIRNSELHVVPNPIPEAQDKCGYLQYRLADPEEDNQN